MQFEPLELHVVDALGQQEVPDYFQQPAKAITEDVSVMRGPQAQEWILAVSGRDLIFQETGKVPKGSATSTPLPARLIPVTKPNVHGGPARKNVCTIVWRQGYGSGWQRNLHATTQNSGGGQGG